MSETTNTVTTPKTEVKQTPKTEVKAVAPKTEVKPVVTPKVEVKTVAPKTEEKSAEVKTVAPKVTVKTKVVLPKKQVPTTKTESSLVGIAEEQLDASAETIINALNALDQQLKDARIAGSERAKEIVKEFGGENKLTDLISKLAGYMGEAAGAGMVAGFSPMIIMAGTAKGIYKKITD